MVSGQFLVFVGVGLELFLELLEDDAGELVEVAVEGFVVEGDDCMKEKTTSDVGFEGRHSGAAHNFIITKDLIIYTQYRIMQSPIRLTLSLSTGPVSVLFPVLFPVLLALPCRLPL